MTRVQISLPVVISEGPKTGHDVESGAPYEWYTPCPGCEKRIDTGEAIVRLGRWYHVDCLKPDQTEDAWLRIAYDVQRRPSQYDVATIRAVIKNLSRMAERGRRLR